MPPPWKLATISPNTWHAITVSGPQDAEEAISELLVGLGAEGVSSFTHDVASASSETLVVIEITGYFPITQSAAELLSRVARQLSQIAALSEQDEVTVSHSSTSPEQWADNWKQFYIPTRITRFLTVAPSWVSDYQAAAGELVIRLDPELAFGTGTHPTTTLALLALEQVIRGDEQVIDIGTGSGVLAIAARLLGAGGVLATDIDDDAVAVAKTNIALNPGTENIQVVANNLLDNIALKADVMIANILAEVLLLLIDDAAKLLNAEGHLILSGIYHDKIDLVANKVLDAGLRVVNHFSQGEWHCLIATPSLAAS